MRKVLALVATALTACATVSRVAGPTERLAVHSDALRVNIEYPAQDIATARQIAEVIPSMNERLRSWGTFLAPVTVRVLPSHEALEAAVGNPGFPWLRAWARYDSIELQSPASWSDRGTTAQVGELLTHELTHCLMYQLSGTAFDWAGKVLPLWFREGMASVAALQGYRRPSNEELSDVIRKDPRIDPLGNAEDLYQANARFVYGAAHRAFELLLARYGERRIKDLFREMRIGRDFDAAFQRAIGVSRVEFEAEFLRFLRWRGWMGRPAPTSSPLIPDSL